MTTLTDKDLARPNGVPLILNRDHAPTKSPRLITFTHWKVGGQEVKLNEKEEVLYIGQDILTPSEWIQIRGRIDVIFMRIQALKKGQESARGKPVSDFLNANLEIINAMQRGHIKEVPQMPVFHRNWVMRLFGWGKGFEAEEASRWRATLDWVITNENLNRSE